MDLKSLLVRQLAQLDLQLDEAIVDSEIDLLMEMLRWNKTHNLTAITDPAEGVEKHLVDSLTLLPHLDGVETVLDIGSGGGFPGLPLQIARPGIKIVSVDAVAKKIAFQRHAARKFGLKQFVPWHGRIERLPLQTFIDDGFDLIVARAFSSLPDLLGLALPYLKAGGRIVAMKGQGGDDELHAAQDWMSDHRLLCSEKVSLALPHSAARRYLLFFSLKPQDVE